MGVCGVWVSFSLMMRRVVRGQRGNEATEGTRESDSLTTYHSLTTTHSHPSNQSNQTTYLLSV